MVLRFRRRLRRRGSAPRDPCLALAGFRPPHRRTRRGASL